jgi:ubiquinone/menaquinone biosynthesis C-methylase UbiE
MNEQITNTQNSYDAVAKEYAEKFIDEIDEKPFDKKMLELLLEKTNGMGIICDLGCGPGNVAKFLHNVGAEVCGIDLSQKQIEEAQKLNKGIQFYQANMLDLSTISDNHFGGVAAFYSIIHIPKNVVLKALREIHRILKQNGTLLITFHTGEEVRHFDEWWGKKVNLDFIFYQTEEMKKYLSEAGFKTDYVIEREPVKEVEVETRRSYIFAVKT